MRFRVNIQHFSDGYITLIDHFDVIGPLSTDIVCRRLFRNEATKQQIIVCSDSHDARNIKHIWIFSPVMSLMSLMSLKYQILCIIYKKQKML